MGGQDMVDDDQELAGESDRRALLAHARCEAVVEGAEIGILAAAGGVGLCWLERPSTCAEKRENLHAKPPAPTCGCRELPTLLSGLQSPSQADALSGQHRFRRRPFSTYYHAVDDGRISTRAGDGPR